MTTTAPHIRLVASGVLGSGGGNEIWSCGLKLIYGTTSDPMTPVAPDQATLDAVSAHAATVWGIFIGTGFPGAFEGGLLSDWVGLTAVKASAVLATGKDDPTTTSSITDVIPTVRGQGPTTGTGGRTNYELPYTVSLVATLRGSTYRRGSGALGRFYIPIPNLYYSETDGSPKEMVNGLIDVTVAQNLATVVATTLLTGLNTYSGSAGHQTTVSNIGNSADLAGLRFQRVSEVLVDTRPDTVRRRSNKISGEGHGTHSL